MREVIRIEEPQEGKKPVELTEYASVAGWTKEPKIVRQNIDKIVYLGQDSRECFTDRFVVYTTDGQIWFFKGHLNSGRY